DLRRQQQQEQRDERVGDLGRCRDRQRAQDGGTTFSVPTFDRRLSEAAGWTTIGWRPGPSTSTSNIAGVSGSAGAVSPRLGMSTWLGVRTSTSSVAGWPTSSSWVRGLGPAWNPTVVGWGVVGVGAAETAVVGAASPPVVSS